MAWLQQVAGSALVAAALADIYLTVLYARSGAGFLSPRLSKATWLLFKAIGRIAGRFRPTVLSFAGSAILVLTAVVWLALLTAGFGLIVWPALGSGIQASSGSTPTDYAAALYYSGYSLTTLGTGDLVPTSSTYRLIMIVQAAIGFSVLTLTLTYFMSVYSALVRRNTLAQGLHQLSGGTADAAEIVARLGAGGTFDSTSSILSDSAFRVLDLLESHHSYPVLHYFRRSDPRYAMARIALLTLDTASLLSSALGKEHAAVGGSAAVEMMRGSGLELLHDVGRSFLPAGAEERAARVAEACANAARYGRAIERLAERSVSVAEDLEKGSACYLASRREWEGTARALAEMMNYPWSDIELLSLGIDRSAA